MSALYLFIWFGNFTTLPRTTLGTGRLARTGTNTGTLREPTRRPARVKKRILHPKCEQENSRSPLTTGHGTGAHYSLHEIGRTETAPLSWLTLGMASLGVSWVGLLRVCNSHGGSASGQVSAARGCPFAGRDRPGDLLPTDQCFWRLLLALCAIATPEAVLGECVAMLLRLWIEPRRKLHR